MTLANRRFERLQHNRAQFAFADVHRRSVEPTLRRAVTYEMLWFCNHRVVAIERFALSTFDIGKTKPSRQVGIFPEILFDAAPSWLPRYVKNRSQHHVHACCPHLEIGRA